MCSATAETTRFVQKPEAPPRVFSCAGKLKIGHCKLKIANWQLATKSISDFQFAMVNFQYLCPVKTTAAYPPHSAAPLPLQIDAHCPTASPSVVPGRAVTRRRSAA